MTPRYRWLTLPERILLHCTVNPETRCWEWQRALNEHGYGVVGKGGGRYAGTTLVHRATYAHWRGEIPEGKYICHRCDNPPCCNPEHLFLGSQEINLEDARVKGRLPGGPSLTDAQVLAIRADDRYQRDIATAHGISQGLVSMIRAGKRYGHVTPTPKPASSRC